MRGLLEQYRWLWRSVETWYPGAMPFRIGVFVWFVLRDLWAATSQRVVATCAVVLAAYALSTAVEQRGPADASAQPWTLSGAVASVSVPRETPMPEINRMAIDLVRLGVEQVEFTLR